MLTAEEAKELTRNSYNDVMTDTYNKIRNAAESGKDSVYITTKSLELVEKMEKSLQELGYTVIPSGQNSFLVVW